MPRDWQEIKSFSDAGKYADALEALRKEPLTDAQMIDRLATRETEAA